MAYVINLCFRAKGEPDYTHLGIVDIGKPLTSDREQTIRLPDGRDVRVRIDQNHLIPVHEYGGENPPIIYVTEV